MTLSPQKFREVVLQLLYSQELAQPEKELMTRLMMTELEISKKNILLAHERVARVLSLVKEIDELVASSSISYSFDRIQIVTKNILRLAVFELFFDQTIPPKVAIAEAIRLSRKFNTPESAAFVNALLDHLYQTSLGVQVDPHQLIQPTEKLIESENLAAENSTTLNEDEPSSYQEDLQ